MTFLISLMSYFDVYRSKAAGLLTTIIGIGPIITPPIIHYTQQTFGSDGCLMIFAGLTFHTIVASLLLQPVEWHMKSVPANEIRLVAHEGSLNNVTIGSETGEFYVKEGGTTNINFSDN